MQGHFVKHIYASVKFLLAIGFVILSTSSVVLAQSSSRNVSIAHALSQAVFASGSAQERTPQQMQQDASKAFPKPAGGIIPFRPTMDIAKYKQAQAQGAQGTHHRPGSTTAAPAVTVIQNFEGATSVDGLVPPDTHGAVGSSQFVEVTNSHINVFARNNVCCPSSKTLAAFFGYFTKTIFDPRVVYDSIWKRWIVTAEASPESSTLQRHFIAISKTSNANGSFFIYRLNVTFATGDFWDFPQLGIDQDAVIITANIFNSSNAFKGADCIAVAKARLYNGLGFSVPLFQGLAGTLAPPVVLDDNPRTFLIAAQPNGSSLQLYTMTNTSRPAGTTLTGPVNVAVPAYSVPPAAQQPGETSMAFFLDTSDNRFVNASTQVGNVLWQVHTINDSGFATPRYYEIDTNANSVIQSREFFAAANSTDFNASIVANSSGGMFVTWSSTQPSAGINAQVRVGSCSGNPCVPGAGVAVFNSSNPLVDDFDPNFGDQRWGDYSALTLDPLNSTHAWLVNEKVNSGGDWGSRIAFVGL